MDWRSVSFKEGTGCLNSIWFSFVLQTVAVGPFWAVSASDLTPRSSDLHFVSPMRAARSAVPVTSDGCQNVCHTTQANICHRRPAHGDTFRSALLALGQQAAAQPPEP